MDILTQRSLADTFKNLFFAIVYRKRNLHNHISTITPTGTADATTTIERFQLAKGLIFQNVVHRSAEDLLRDHIQFNANSSRSPIRQPWSNSNG